MGQALTKNCCQPEGMDDEDLKKARQAAMEQAAMTSMKRGVLG